MAQQFFFLASLVPFIALILVFFFKSQLLSNGQFVSSNLPKNQRNFSKDLCSSLQKEVESKK